MLPKLSLVESVRLARRLHKELMPNIRPQRIVYIKEAKGDDKGNLHDIEESFNSSYCDPLPALLKYVSTQTNLRIVINTMDLCTCVTGLSFVRPDQNVLEIRVRKDASFCVKRFAILKELLHYVEPDLAAQETTKEALTGSIASAAKCRTTVPDKFEPLHPEAFCYYTAIETLLWWGDEGAARHRLLGYRDDRSKTDEVIAAAFRVPRYVIQFFFDGEKSYSARSLEINSCMPDDEVV